MSQTFHFQHADVFEGGAKIAECHSFTLKLMGNDEAQFGAEGFLAYSQGATTSSGEITEVVPEEGTTFSWDQALLNKQDLSLQFATIDGNIWEIVMRVLDSEYNSDVQKGTLNRKISLGGGKPQITS